MPMPTPDKETESHDEFISRCMADEIMVSDYEDEDQRYAVCQSQWDKERTMAIDIPELRYLPFHELRVQREEGKPAKIVGYPVVFDSWSEDLGGFREIVRPTVAAALERGTDILSLFNHDSNYVLGRRSNGTLTLSADERGIYYEVEPPDTQWARDLMVSIERGDVKGGSFQFRTITDRWNSDYTERELIDADIPELGPVTFPAYSQTDASVRMLIQEIENRKNLQSEGSEEEQGGMDSDAPKLQVEIERLR